MTLYQTIFTRRSVRKYDKQPLSQEVLEDIKTFLETTDQLAGGEADFAIVNAGAVSDDKAPHYILAFCEHNFVQNINVGFALQKTDLYLQSLGLGSVWLGIGKPHELVKNKKPYCIMMGFGKPREPMRAGEQDFNRLPINKVSNADNALARAGRIAPSTMNTQPWVFKFDENKVVVDYCGRGLAQVFLRSRMSKLDLGIAARHIALALLKEGKTIKSITPKGNEKQFSVEILFN